jgi:cyclophilin family peptidyl-prolyl cis-trans isomerase
MLRLGILAAGVALAVAAPVGASCPFPNPDARRRVELATALGSLCLDLFDRTGEAPGTVENFLGYAQRGDYDGTFFHRLVQGFVIQGGGYRFDPVARYQPISVGPQIANEPGISNTRGTVAMAKVSGLPNSATSQWFVNLVDNVGLDADNGGFTVFARVVPESLPVLDALGALHSEFGPWAILDDPGAVRPALRNLPVLEILERDPAGYGCLKVFPDPTAQGNPFRDQSACADSAALSEGILLTRTAMDPQVPERLVTLDEVVVVPEPGAPWLLAAGATALAAIRLRRSRRPRGVRGIPEARDLV